MNCKYPDINVKLSGYDGNAFNIIGRVRGAMRHAGVPEKELKEFLDDALSGDYNHVLVTAMKWVNVT